MVHKMLASLLFVAFVTFEVSHAAPSEAECAAKFATCLAELQAAATDLQTGDMDQICKVLPTSKTCFDGVANDCKDSFKQAALFSESLAKTFDAMCNDKNPLYQKIRDQAQCMKDKNDEINKKCVKTPAPGETPTKDTICKMIKDAIACIPGELGKVCNKDAQDVMTEIFNIWQPLIKDQCGGAGAVTSFLTLILAALFVVFKMNSHSGL